MVDVPLLKRNFSCNDGHHFYTTSNLFRHNGQLFFDYGSFIVKRWKSHYLHYDTLKRHFSYCMIHSDWKHSHRFEDDLQGEIDRVHLFVEDRVNEILRDLQIITIAWSAMSQDVQNKILEEQENGHPLERSMRQLYSMILELQNFYRLNCYIVDKIMEDIKILHNKITSSGEYDDVVCSPHEGKLNIEYEHFMNFDHVSKLKEKCVDTYALIFLKSNTVHLQLEN